MTKYEKWVKETLVTCRLSTEPQYATVFVWYPELRSISGADTTGYRSWWMRGDMRGEFRHILCERLGKKPSRLQVRKFFKAFIGSIEHAEVGANDRED